MAAAVSQMIGVSCFSTGKVLLIKNLMNGNSEVLLNNNFQILTVRLDLMVIEARCFYYPQT